MYIYRTYIYIYLYIHMYIHIPIYIYTYRHTHTWIYFSTTALVHCLACSRVAARAFYISQCRPEFFHWRFATCTWKHCSRRIFAQSAWKTERYARVYFFLACVQTLERTLQTDVYVDSWLKEMRNVDTWYAQIDTWYAQIDTWYAQIDTWYAQIDTWYAQMRTYTRDVKTCVCLDTIESLTQMCMQTFDWKRGAMCTRDTHTCACRPMFYYIHMSRQ